MAVSGGNINPYFALHDLLDTICITGPNLTAESRAKILGPKMLGVSVVELNRGS